MQHHSFFGKVAKIYKKDNNTTIRHLLCLLIFLRIKLKIKYQLRMQAFRRCIISLYWNK